MDNANTTGENAMTTREWNKIYTGLSVVEQVKLRILVATTSAAALFKHEIY
jgi:hypothetical protein